MGQIFCYAKLKFMKKIVNYLSCLCMFSFFHLHAQEWRDVSMNQSASKGSKRTIIPKVYRKIEVDQASLLTVLNKAPHENVHSKGSDLAAIAIPMPDGSISHFTIQEYDISEPLLKEKFPTIKTYRGQGIEDRTATITLDWTAAGFHAMILSSITGSVWIDPYAQGTTATYISYFKKDLKPKAFTEEGLIMMDGNNELQFRAATGGICVGTQLRTYRLAVACTGEYAQAVGGTSAALLHSAIVTTVNRVNGVFEKELSVRLVLIGNNNVVEYLNAATDPFTGNNNASILINESQTVINANIGAANYDIGHTFSTGGGGLAGLGVVCNNNNKAKGITGSYNPTGDAYDIDYVAHEMGHQFGARHTFNAASGSCSGNGSTTTNAEPGSGSTIMAYAGICAANDLQPNSDPQFHAVSFNEITAFTNTGAGSACAAISNTNNRAPVAVAGNNYTIPVSTPFILSGSGTDADGDALTYSWEEIDVAGPFTNWNAPTGDAPLFRSFPPTVSPNRVLPKLQNILNGTTSIGEVLPGYVRDMNFRLTVRDNRSGGGGVCFSNMKVTTAGNAAFTVTSQNTPTVWNANGTNMATITWNVAGTNAAPVLTQNVDIFLSTDGGISFPYPLAANTPNDGTENILIPSIATSNARIMVMGVGNIFFNVNAISFTIVPGCPAITCPSSIIKNISTGCSDSMALPAPVLGNCTSTISSVVWKLSGATLGSSDTTGINYLAAKRFNVGVTTVTYVAKDNFGSSATCSFTVTVKEAIKPVIYSPGNVVKYVTSSCSPSVYVPKPTYSDNCGAASLTWTISGATSGSSVLSGINFIGSRVFNIGISNVTYTITDKSGNTSSCVFTVSVSDTTRPYVKFMPNYTVFTTIDSCSKIVAVSNPVITDPCGVTSVSWSMTGATIRSSSLSGINYLGKQLYNVGTTSVAYTIKDAFGNTTVTSFVVRVKPLNPTFCGFAKSDIDNIGENEQISLSLSPNPTSRYFILQIKSTIARVSTINVYSSNGKRVEMLKNISENVVRFGEKYPSGVYYIDLIQGEVRRTVKGLKL